MVFADDTFAFGGCQDGGIEVFSQCRHGRRCFVPERVEADENDWLAGATNKFERRAEARAVRLNGHDISLGLGP
jgi:hypothetical protein